MKKTMFLAALMGAVVLTAPAMADVTYNRTVEVGESIALGETVTMGATPILLTIDLTNLGNVTSDTELIRASVANGTHWGMLARNGGNVAGMWGDSYWNDGRNFTVGYSTIQGVAEAGSTTVTLLATVDTTGTYLKNTDSALTALGSSSALMTARNGEITSYKVTNNGIVTAANKALYGTYTSLSGEGTLSLDVNSEMNGGADGGSVTVNLNNKTLTVTGNTTLDNINNNGDAGGSVVVKEGVTLTTDINSGYNISNITVEEGGAIAANEMRIATNRVSNITGAGSLTTNSLATGNGGKIDTSIADFTVNGDVALNATTATQGAMNDYITVSGGNFHVTGDVSLNKAGTALNITGGTATVDGTISGVGTVNVGAGQTLTAGAINGTKITLAAGSTIELGTDHDGTLTTSSMTVNGNATINADLVTAANSTITFTEGTVTLGCSVTFGSGTTIALGEAYVEDMTANGQVLLFTGVDGLDPENLKNVTVTIANVQGILKAELQGDGSYNIYATPEPATATLSLLALAGLMARRKRH